LPSCPSSSGPTGFQLLVDDEEQRVRREERDQDPGQEAEDGGDARGHRDEDRGEHDLHLVVALEQLAQAEALAVDDP
jgi:hypothetical protein